MAMEGPNRRLMGGNGAGLVAVSPSHTPRSSDKVFRENRSSDGSGCGNGKLEKDKGVNIQVLLRCRPSNETEVHNITSVICNELRREVSVTQNIANKQIDRTFVFDKVFGPKSKQKDLFEHAVVPIVNEVLEGYNCTIFAYGQTGTGKTYTMEGGGTKMQNGELPSDAGVIPRAVRHIFDLLEQQGTEYSMKVSFLELYNEEITDLLVSEESKFPDDKSKKPITLMEDGKGGVFVKGLEEEIVASASEIYKILERGSSKRRTAETLLNKQSSRSHSIFSITIHIKECTPEGEEMIKCGKLNLVDLAGSENVTRSGAREGRAREAGEINRSLLTLGRVINTLVEHSGHIPYRDSKLTRLLRDSLGGKTKTCIIATISPSIHSLEETLSTLDYAHRAKNIKNKPEVNQRMMKSALIKDLYSDIDRLKQELYAAREKNGIYIPREQHLSEEAEKKALTERLHNMENAMESKDKKLVELQDLFDSEKVFNAELTEKLKISQKRLEDTDQVLSDLEEKHRQANMYIKEKEFVIKNILQAENDLSNRAHELRFELENAAADISALFQKIERKDKIEDANMSNIQTFHTQLVQDLKLLHKAISVSITSQDRQLHELEQEMQRFISTKNQVNCDLQGQVERLKEIFVSTVKEFDHLTSELDNTTQETLHTLKLQAEKHTSAIKDCVQEIVLDAEKLHNEVQNGLSEQEERLNSFLHLQLEGLSRTAEARRSISTSTMNFFLTLDSHALKLDKMLEESQGSHDEKVSIMKRQFEDITGKEEAILLQQVAELLAESNARKKDMFRTAIIDLQESASRNTNKMKHEMLEVQNVAASVREQWKEYADRTEKQFEEDRQAVESEKACLVEGLRQCMLKESSCWEQWNNAKISLVGIALKNGEYTSSIIRDGLEADQQLLSRVSSTTSSAIENVDAANKDLLAYIENMLELDNGAHETIKSLTASSHRELQQLQDQHSNKVTRIADISEASLLRDYLVEKPTCSTPKRRQINLCSMQSIDELKTPPFEVLLKSFSAKNAKLPNGEEKQFCAVQESQLQTQRSPLVAKN